MTPIYASTWANLMATLQQPGGARQLAEQAMAAAEANAELNAYRRIDPAKVLAEADAADIRRTANPSAPALCGVPISAKDLYVVNGYDTFAGTSMALDGHFPDEGPVVHNLRGRSAVITGKTHTVEFAFGGIGTNPHWPSPINPWSTDADRVSGGSSSGAGVSLWTGTAVLALGTDTAGSVRVPASFTGAIGLKTTHGRWSIDGIVPLSPSLDTAGFLALNADAIAEAFIAVDDTAAHDAESICRAWPGRVKGLMLGVARQAFEGVEAGIGDVTERALKELEAAGAVLKDVTLPEFDDAEALFKVGGVAGIEFAASINNDLPEWRDKLDPNVKARFAAIEQATAGEYLSRMSALSKMQTSVARRMNEFGIDALAGPTVPISPPTIQEVADGDRYVNRNMLALRNTMHGNFLKLAGFTIPAGMDEIGMPAGLQIMTRAGSDIYAMGLLLAFERVLGRPYDRLGKPPKTA
jgi:aspartyl-tRNA(Asn)/glutamyl-tRNA(Gln) amidotransferase subunit A